MSVRSGITAEGLKKRYGRLEALSECTFEAAPGSIVALVGPNGAGKTTALKLLVGLLAPTAGDAWICGHHVQREPLEAKRVLGFLPDQPFLYEALTISETLSFIGSMYGLDRRTLRERGNALLRMVDLAERLHSRVSELSYGMKSRLSIVTALLHEPRALIMDEPFFGLDPKTLRLMRQVMRERAAAGTAILLSTHQLSVVEDLADRVIILSRGRIVTVDSVDGLRRAHGAGSLEDIFVRLTDVS
ncbi:MAG TPA: ABC transporter ATP-binding protein [bacterium]